MHGRHAPRSAHRDLVLTGTPEISQEDDVYASTQKANRRVPASEVSGLVVAFAAICLAFATGGTNLGDTAWSKEVDEDARLVVYDTNNIEYVPTSIKIESVSGLKQLEMTFDVAPNRVRTFAFQTRAFQWAKFSDIALRPRK